VDQVRRSWSLVKVHGHGKENVAKVVGATSSGGFLVYDTANISHNVFVSLPYCRKKALKRE